MTGNQEGLESDHMLILSASVTSVRKRTWVGGMDQNISSTLLSHVDTLQDLDQTRSSFLRAGWKPPDSQNLPALTEPQGEPFTFPPHYW